MTFLNFSCCCSSLYSLSMIFSYVILSAKSRDHFFILFLLLSVQSVFEFSTFLQVLISFCYRRCVKYIIRSVSISVSQVCLVYNQISFYLSVPGRCAWFIIRSVSISVSQVCLVYNQISFYLSVPGVTGL